MQQATTSITVATAGKGLYEITGEAERFVSASGIGAGLLTLFCRHTSAGLLITENAAGAVRRDLFAWLERVVPEGAGYEHDDEGPDDMPAHIRTMLTGVSLAVPVTGARISLGTWQGVFLAEHRRAPHRREVTAHLVGE